MQRAPELSEDAEALQQEGLTQVGRLPPVLRSNGFAVMFDCDSGDQGAHCAACER